MNQQLQSIQDIIQQNSQLSEQDKQALLKLITTADKQWSITEFKLDRTEKVKRTTTILLDETIEELENKRKAVEAQNRELEIESSLERVRTVAMGMSKPDDMLHVCHIISDQLELLGTKEIRNVQTAIFNSAKGTYMNYEYYRLYDKSLITEVDYTKDPRSKGFSLQMQKGPGEFFSETLTGKVLSDWFEYQKGSEQFADPHLTIAPSLSYYWFSLGPIALGISTYAPLNEEEISLFNRFRNVFELSYRRFLDIEKAEAQVRESQVQLAMERVRARTMAMQQSQELPDAANLLFQQVQSLGMPAWSAGYCIWDDDKKAVTLWMSSAGIIQQPFKAPLTEDPAFIHFYEAWQRGDAFYVESMGGEELVSHYKYMCNLPVVGEMLNKFTNEGGLLPAFQIFHLVFFTQGFLLFITYEPVPEAHEIFRRFGKVFDQTYTRFLDLQRAELQAKEAQIEAALERVRSRSMAMHQSSDLQQVIKVVAEQLIGLGLKFESVNFTKVYDDRSWDLWIATPQRVYPTHIYLPYLDHRMFNEWYDHKEGSEYFAQEFSHEEKNVFFNYFFDKVGLDMPEERKEYLLNAKVLCRTVFYLKNIFLAVANYDIPYTDEENALLKRFAIVFEQSYTRFLDLQKAEAQAKEAQIEASLERVRSHSMAMHQSSDLQQVIKVVAEQLMVLGLKFESVNFTKLHDDRSWDLWIATPQRVHPTHIYVPYLDHRIFNEWYDYKDDSEYFVQEFSQEEKNIFFNYFFDKVVPDMPEERKEYLLRGKALCRTSFHLKNIWLAIANYDMPYTDEENAVLKRFAIVFEQSYTRFLDLQKAEAQAREAQIEASLERVRSKTMAMHNSQDVGETVALLFDELRKLSVETIRCGVGIMHDNMNMELWTARSDTNGKIDMVIGQINMDLHPLLQGAYNGWRHKEESYSYELNDEDLVKYFTAVNDHADYPVKYEIDKLPRQIFHNDFYFAEGTLFAFSLEQLKEDHRKIFKRFAGVFGQTYRRYLDLQKAEAQVRESHIEAALERVRSRTLAMQKSDELAETAVVLFKQLIGLGIEPNRLYIGIVRGETGDMEMWATDEDGTEVGTKFMFNKDENASVKKLYDGWAAQLKSVVVSMEGKELEEYFHYLSKVMRLPFKGGLTQKRRVQHVAYFSKGFIGLASPDEQSQDTLQLLERFAAVFNLTFTRFNDLKVAEAHAEQAELDLIKLQTEKRRAEDALTELRATQTQLIQSEKMASLGELTAGIAHEIQNPLNFVNNFSEVSMELIEEVKNEKSKAKGERDEELENDLLSDIASNLEKILHHGKRADGIVKGMLQHSRRGSGQKEPTDINALADEYLRLAYHGLRAKDKSFNATMTDDFDKSIGIVNVVPQDIGRVILNLITNAFYATDIKKKAGVENYHPTVSVSTRKINGKIEISVKDNGSGIPAKVLDKIFQPFFTTKPTGQGTGLGLSLAYDIVKAHGGDLKVETKEHEGSQFTIQLPIN